MPFQIKRIYEPVEETDGLRLLVDRLWPRGVSKEGARLGDWVKDLAPSSQLRTWFAHKAENFEEFAMHYRAELNSSPQAQAAVHEAMLQGKETMVTLLYGAKDPKINHAVVLMGYLEEKSL